MGRPRIVDSHAHVFSPEVVARPETYRERDGWFALLNPDPRPRLATADDLTGEMARSGVDVSVAVGFGWRDQALCIEQNDALIAAGRNSGGRIVPFCTVQPRAGAAAAREVERCAAAGCRGVGELYPDGQAFAVDDLADVGPLLEVCRALRLPILIHASEPVGHSYRGKGRDDPGAALRSAAPGGGCAADSGAWRWRFCVLRADAGGRGPDGTGLLRYGGSGLPLPARSGCSTARPRARPGALWQRLSAVEPAAYAALRARGRTPARGGGGCVGGERGAAVRVAGGLTCAWRPAPPALTQGERGTGVRRL